MVRETSASDPSGKAGTRGVSVRVPWRIRAMKTIDLRKMVVTAIAEDEAWIARARAIMRGCDGDVSTMREQIAAAQRDVDKMRALL